MTRRVQGKTKGNAFEWRVARTLSLWATAGEDKTQLIPSRGSGGWAGKAGEEAWRQIGDLAPNGPAGEELRRHFAVECKHRRMIDLWHHWTAQPGENIHGWWRKLLEEIAADGGEDPPAPLLIVRANNRPIMAALPSELIPGYMKRSSPRVLVSPQEGFALLPLDDLLLLSPGALYARLSTYRKSLQ